MNEFGVRELGIQAAQLACDCLAMDREAFLALKPKDHEGRSSAAVLMQRGRESLNEAVRINRSRFKVITGGKHESGNS